MAKDDNSHLAERARKAARIAASPSDYKVCEGCDSIVKAHVATCPNCHGYRFDDNPKAVVFYAGVLASREQRSVVEEDLM
ncbi:MAG TPA: hypothetical protein VG733_09505 [Chthoniobacteraceae bacterium]|nr:hypothetical protein [Chthoniobacteraceae bacterium]